ncbi:TIGR02444 family protein [Neptuniibacter sp. 1_MG-2023]|uniref:TIGR02444 family protein n=1 Tax=Neptuniibacter sp. 1_MG-2023 TaxID=3062662 RepID=UPI0026E4101A|nr:TIGR02444 family protein [Neptuniibacter sp. 1_MG-2023]MDO6594552.1 TIGR02444 family protein [Neptuniibacter sp. 1_MG-2023]
MQLKNDLWDFALNFYQQPGIESACLLLQDQFGLSINRVIYAVWCGCQGEKTEVGVSDDADQWQFEVAGALRDIRFRVRGRKADCGALAECYDKLKQAELACEQVEFAMLYQQKRVYMQSKGSRSLVRNNLESYIATANVEVSPELELAIGPILSALNHYL